MRNRELKETVDAELANIEDLRKEVEGLESQFFQVECDRIKERCAN